MAKKDNSSVDKITKRVNKEFEKTSRHLEGIIGDALKQFDSLQHQVQEPIRKLLKDVDERREKEMKRLSEEFDRRLNEFHEMQQNILERLGVSTRDKRSSAKGKSDKNTSSAKPAASASSPKTATKSRKTPEAPRKAASTKTKAATTRPKPGAKAKPAAAKKPADNTDLTRIKGIGPATAKKMQDAGITSIEQIANPTEVDTEKLQAFSGIKGFRNLEEEAKKVL